MFIKVRLFSNKYFLPIVMGNNISFAFAATGITCAVNSLGTRIAFSFNFK